MTISSYDPSKFGPLLKAHLEQVSEQVESQCQERDRLETGNIAGLRVTITEPMNRGDYLHNDAMAMIGRYQDRGCKFDNAGIVFLLNAYSKLKQASEVHNVDESETPLCSLVTLRIGLQENVGQHNEHLNNYLNGEGHRSELLKATDEIKVRLDKGEAKLKMAYLTCLALCELNNYS